MKSRSAKNKGVRLQNWVRDMLIAVLDLIPDDIKPAVMGESGIDVRLFGSNKSKFPFAIECKNVEKLNVWAAYEQSKTNKEDLEPILVMKKNHKKPLVVIDAEYFFEMQNRINMANA